MVYTKYTIMDCEPRIASFFVGILRNVGRYVRLPIFIKIVKVTRILYESVRFDSKYTLR